MNNFTELETFINNNPDWINLLKASPYNMKTITQCPYNDKMWMLVYNLFSSDLTNPIVKECRGTVVYVDNGKCSIVCAPYLKFFNYNDPISDIKKIDFNSAFVEDKIDGQLIKFSKFQGVGYWYTNGGFTVGTPMTYTDKDISNYRKLLETALKADDKYFKSSKNIPDANASDDEIEKIYNTPFGYESNWTDKIPEGYTLMFELTSKYNVIQVKYDNPKIWFHGIRDNMGNEFDPNLAVKMFDIPYQVPGRYNLHNMNDIIATLKTFKDDKEGFVVCDKNFNRIKCKSDVYLQMKMASDISTPKALWELTISEQYDDVLPMYPDLKPLIDSQIAEFNKIKMAVDILCERALDLYSDCGNDKKQFAAKVIKDHSVLKQYYFNAIKYGTSEKLYDVIMNKLKQSANGYKDYVAVRDLLITNLL